MQNRFIPKMTLLNGYYEGEYSGGTQGGGSQFVTSMYDPDTNTTWIYIGEDSPFLDFVSNGVGWYSDDLGTFYGPEPGPTWVPMG